MRRLGVIFPTSEWKEVTYQTDDGISASESNSISTPLGHHSAVFQKAKVNSNNKKPIQDLSVLEMEIERELIKNWIYWYATCFILLGKLRSGTLQVQKVRRLLHQEGSGKCWLQPIFIELGKPVQHEQQCLFSRQALFWTQ